MGEAPSLKQVLEKNGFVLVRPLSDKVFPSVFLVYSQLYKQEFVCKVVEKLHLFENELSSLSALYHTNIIKVFKYFEENSKYYLILEFCPNGNLRNFIRRKVRPKPDAIMRYIQDLSSAVYYCHSQKIAHLDIKPSNILIDQYGRLRLADFGISGRFPDNVCTSYIGTYEFMAPEIRLNQPFDPFKADVWSLGVTIYYIAFGILPLHNKKNGVTNILFPFCSSPVINRILNKALVFDPKMRASIKQIRSIVTHTLQRTTTETQSMQSVQITKPIVAARSEILTKNTRRSLILSSVKY